MDKLKYILRNNVTGSIKKSFVRIQQKRHYGNNYFINLACIRFELGKYKEYYIINVILSKNKFTIIHEFVILTPWFCNIRSRINGLQINVVFRSTYCIISLIPMLKLCKKRKKTYDLMKNTIS